MIVEKWGHSHLNDFDIKVKINAIENISNPVGGSFLIYS